MPAGQVLLIERSRVHLRPLPPRLPIRIAAQSFLGFANPRSGPGRLQKRRKVSRRVLEKH